LALFKARRPDFVVTDLKMAGMDGVQVLRECRALEPDVPVMVITAYGTIDVAVDAMKAGAHDFLTKPFSPDVLRLKVERALETRRARTRAERLQRENEILRGRWTRCRLRRDRGASAAHPEDLRDRRPGGPSDSSVFISGESGTGKELVRGRCTTAAPAGTGPSCG